MGRYSLIDQIESEALSSVTARILKQGKARRKADDASRKILKARRTQEDAILKWLTSFS